MAIALFPVVQKLERLGDILESGAGHALFPRGFVPCLAPPRRKVQ
jgi:hypothetical protein